MTPVLVHLSDPHLGFRAFPRTEQGWNLRERDISSAFRWALQETIRIRPDIVLITGDLFDRPDPPHTALLTFHRGVGFLRTRLPGVPILLIAGERDTPPNPAELGPVAILDSLPGVEAATLTPRSLRFREAGIHALLVPHRAALQPPWPEIRPDPTAAWNLLLIRGDFDRGEGGIPINAGEWSYVAVGGPHRPMVWAPNVRAAGALERPERNPWMSTAEERGFISFDLEKGEGEFHPVPGRPVVDLAPVRVSTGDPLTGGRRLREVVEGLPGGIDGKVVRVRLSGDIMSPGEGVTDGLVAALAERASHVEYRLSSMGDSGAHYRGTEGEFGWSPALLLTRGAGPNEAEEALPETGIVLLTAESEDLRARLARELREGAPASGINALLQLSPPAPVLGSRLSLLAVGALDPAHLVRAGLDVDGTKAAAPSPDMDSPASLPPPSAMTPSLVTAEPHPEMIVRMEAELGAMRADWVEASGDLEAKTLEWVRERQDADSHLQGYRDRARELRARIQALEADGEGSLCPTCEKPIGKQISTLTETLRDEWEGVVQDGKWWKRRREQLDPKPLDLRKMEERSLRLHSQLEEMGERLEVERERERHNHSSDLHPGALVDQSRVMESLPPLDTLPRVRELLRSAGSHLHRWTEGRIMGVGVRGSDLLLLGIAGEERHPEGSDLAALRLALRLTLRQRLAPEGGGGALLLWELHESGCGEIGVSLMEHLAATTEDCLVLAVVPPSVLGASPDRYRFAIEFRTDERGRIRSRRIPGGVPVLKLEVGVGG